MSKLIKTTPEEEKAYLKKANQYKRVKLIILITSIVVAVVSGIIVIGNGKILRALGFENASAGVDLFIMLMYILVIVGIIFFLFMMISSGIYQLISFFKDKFGK